MHRLRFHAPFTSFNLLSYIKYLCAEGAGISCREAAKRGLLPDIEHDGRSRPVVQAAAASRFRLTAMRRVM